MQHKSIPPLKISQRVMCCMVALLLILTLASFPIKASAMKMTFDKDEGYVGNLSSGGGGGVQMAAGAALLSVMIAAAGDFADDAASGIVSLWNSLSSGVKSWFEKDAVAALDGVPVRVPEEVTDELEEKGAQYGVAFPAGDLFLRPITSELDLSSLTFEDCFAMSLQELMVYNLSLLSTLQLVLTDFRYDVSAQYKNMKAVFYDQMIETRVYLGVHIDSLKSALYDRIGNLSDHMELQFVETRQVLQKVLYQTTTDIYNNITRSRNQIIEQLIQTRGAVTNSLSGIKSAIDSIAADVGSLAGSKDDADDQLAVFPGLSFSSLRDSLTSVLSGVKSFFGGSDEDDDSYPFVPLIPPSIGQYFDQNNSPFLDAIRDSEFMAAIEGFFSFVASLWLLFPLAIRYLISFGFGVPMTFSIIKMLMG